MKKKNNIFDRKQSKENEGYIDNNNDNNGKQSDQTHDIFYRKQQKEDKDYIEKENDDSHGKQSDQTNNIFNRKNRKNSLFVVISYKPRT